MKNPEIPLWLKITRILIVITVSLLMFRPAFKAAPQWFQGLFTAMITMYLLHHIIPGIYIGWKSGLSLAHNFKNKLRGGDEHEQTTNAS